MHKRESVLENVTHKILSDSEVQTHHLIPVRRPDLVIINKKNVTLTYYGFAVQANNRVKIREKEKRDKYRDFARKPSKFWNMSANAIKKKMYQACLEQSPEAWKMN